MAATTENSNKNQDDFRLVRQYERRQLKLGKRLAYLLRYGAEKEGCQVDEGKIYSYQNETNHQFINNEHFC